MVEREAMEAAAADRQLETVRRLRPARNVEEAVMIVLCYSLRC